MEEGFGTKFAFHIPHCWCGSVLAGLLIGGKVFLLVEDLVTKLKFDMVLAVMSFCMTVQPAFGRKSLTTPILCTLEPISI